MPVRLEGRRIPGGRSRAEYRGRRPLSREFMNTHDLYVKTPPLKLFFFAALPGSISMLASALYQLIDGMLVGQLLSATAFAALNLAMPFVIINFALADLIGVGSSVPISIHLGQGHDEEANNIFTCACLMIVITGAVVGAIMYALAPALIAMMGAEGEFAQLAVSYLRVYALCSPVTTIVFATDNYLRISGRVRTSMALNIVMSVLSAGLEFLFLGVIGMSIEGAALGTCLGMVICAIAALSFFATGRLQLRFCRPKFNFPMIRQIVKCGTPNFLNNIAGRITSVLMNMLLVRLGGQNAVSVYGILMYVDGFVQPLLYGMCDSLQPAVGYNWGARRLDRVKSIERCCFTAGGILSLASAVVIFLIPGPIASLFATDAALIGQAAAALRLFSATYITRWFSFATQSYMLAVEHSLQASVISVCTALVFPVLLIAALWPLGLTGIWLNFAGTSVLAAALSAVVMLRFPPRQGAGQPHGTSGT